MSSQNQVNETRLGILYALMAYISWGILPLYWKLLKGLPPLEILVHRIICSFLFTFGILVLRERHHFLQALRQSWPSLKYLAISSVFLTLNWFAFIYAVISDRVLESSLGYYMAPIIQILLGTIVLKENLRVLQKIAVGSALLGVIILTLRHGSVPYIALFLGFTFGFYSLSRKKVKSDLVVASGIEAFFQFVPIIVLFFLWDGGALVRGVRTHSWNEIGLLAFQGVITPIPLLWFANAIKRLPLSLLGFLQFTSPTLQFVLAVFVFSEEFSQMHLLAFICIWASWVVFCYDSIQFKIMEKKRKKAGS